MPGHGAVEDNQKAPAYDPPGDPPAGFVVIIGAGPCGLGAAWRLTELGHTDFVVLEQASEPGGLASSAVDDMGFTWDMGGHVVFSHYEYFDRLLDGVCGDWCKHLRSAWVWMRERFVAYPLQNNIHRLPAKERDKCLEGLRGVQRPGGEPRQHASPPANFHEWLERGFGRGILEVFMTPYNRKVWGCDPREMNVEWMGERVATVDLQQVEEGIRTGRNNVSWGPNHTFRFPLRGGSGAIWKGLASRIPQERFRFGSRVVGVDAGSRTVRLDDGETIRYDHLVSTMPLDQLCAAVAGPGLERLPGKAKLLKHSSTHVVGLGMEGRPPAHLEDKCWVYFPEDNCCFYRATLFSRYSPFHVPRPGKTWSLLLEVCESPQRPVDQSTLVDEVVRGALATKLLSSGDSIISRFHCRLEYGYPTPFVGRDTVVEPILRALDGCHVHSRGRFGAWRYEVSNQDHSCLQGVEVIDRILHGTPEVTVAFPAAVNNGSCDDQAMWRARGLGGAGGGGGGGGGGRGYSRCTKEGQGVAAGMAKQEGPSATVRYHDADALCAQIVAAEAAAAAAAGAAADVTADHAAAGS